MSYGSEFSYTLYIWGSFPKLAINSRDRKAYWN